MRLPGLAKDVVRPCKVQDCEQTSHPKRISQVRRKKQIAMGVLLILWVVCGGFAIPTIIKSAYLGESWPVFNRVISGQQELSMDFYQTLWGHYFWSVFAVLTVAFSAALMPVALLKRQILIFSKAGISLSIFLLVCEIILRVLFWNGETFGTHAGPIMRRFERNFILNAFDESRGPAVSGPKKNGEVRVLVQGDSISWGQGLQDEREAYPSRLLDLFREENPQVEMLVLAKGGREIDGHLEQVIKYGASVQPDVILYQWYVNDLELEDAKARKPGRAQGWRKLRVYRKLLRHSYFFFLLDYHLNAMRPGTLAAYEQFMLENFEADTPCWREFADTFRRWAEECKELTPKVGLVLYPHSLPTGRERLAVLERKVVELGAEMGIKVLDLAPVLADFTGNPKIGCVSRYDNHPSASVHERMARAIHEWATALWPDITAPEPDSDVQRVL